MKKVIREAIFSSSCDFCGTEKINTGIENPEGWHSVRISSREQIYGLNLEVTMCDTCFNKLPEATKAMIVPPLDQKKK